MSQSSQRNLILESDLKTIMWHLSWPAVLAMVLYGLNNFLDAVFVGQLMDNKALAAVGVAFPLSQIAVGAGAMIGTGSGSLLSLWIGSEKKEQLYLLAGNVNTISLLTSLIFTVPCYFFAKDLIILMGASEDIVTPATSYFRITLLGSFFWIHGLALNMMVRAEGKMKTAAAMMAIGLAVDILLKPLLISPFGLGIDGAAWTTNIAMITYSMTGLYYFSSKSASFKTSVFSFKLNPEILKSICSLGSSALIMYIMTVVQSLLIFNTLSNFGDSGDIAFYSAVNRYYIFLLTPIYGLMRALQPVIGMNYGAGLYLRAKEAFKLFSYAGTLLLIPFFLISMLLPQLVLHSMMPNTEFTSQQISNFRIYISVIPLLPVIFLAFSFFPSIENGKSASALVVLRQIVLFIPLMLLLPPIFGTASIYWGSALIDFLVTLVVLFLINKEFKKWMSLESSRRNQGKSYRPLKSTL